MKNIYIAISLIIVITGGFMMYSCTNNTNTNINANTNNNTLPTVAIANYGPHASLEAAIKGFKMQMEAEGFIENKTIRYVTADTGFESNLIPQMLRSLKAKNPKVMMVMTTPVAQAAKSKIQDIPLIYNAITDPIEAGLLHNKHMPYQNITGSSDQQDLTAFLEFARSVLPQCKKIGLLYASGEANDTALLNMMHKSVAQLGMELVAIPVEQARDVPVRMQAFNGKVDCIYVGTSGPIQPSLPAIAAQAQKMHIPVFNVESQAVKDGLALASFGVDYIAVGKNAGKLAAAVLRGEKVNTLTPLYPTTKDHHGVVNKKLADIFNIDISKLPNTQNIEIVE